MKKIFKLFVLTLTCFVFTQGVAQTALWEKSLVDQLDRINWIQQANDGTIICGGNKATLGVDYESGEILWENTKMKAVNPGTVQLIDPLPFLIAQYTNLMGTKMITTILNSRTGEIIYDSKEDGASIMQYHLIEELGGILFEIKQDKQYKAMLLDLNTSKISWTVSLGKAKGGLKGLIKRAINNSFLIGGPLLVDNSLILLPMKEDIYAVDVNGGSIKWHNELEDKLKSIVLNEDNSKFFLGQKDKLDIVDVNSGKSTLEKPLKLKGEFVGFADEGGQYFVMSKKGFNVLDKKTGTLKWKKKDGLAEISEVYSVGNNYVALAEADDKAIIYYVDENGKKIWNKDVDGGMIFNGPVDQGIFYLTNTRSNILNFEKGKAVWKKNIGIKGNPAVAFDGATNQFFIFSDGKLHQFDIEKGEAKLLIEDVKMYGFRAKKDFADLEVRNGGFFISSSQNTLFISKDYQIKYNKHYDPVKGIEGLDQVATASLAAMGLDVDVAQYRSDFAMLSSATRGSFKQGVVATSAAKESKVVGGMYVNKNPVFELSSVRYHASQETLDYIYIFTRYMDKEASKRIVKINKDNGEVEKSLILKDENPTYIVDEYSNSIFVSEKSKTLIRYDMK